MAQANGRVKAARDMTEALFLAALANRGFKFVKTEDARSFSLDSMKIHKTGTHWVVLDQRWRQVAGSELAPEANTYWLKATNRREALSLAIQHRAWYTKRIAEKRAAELKRDCEIAATLGILVPQFIQDYHATRHVKLH